MLVTTTKVAELNVSMRLKISEHYQVQQSTMQQAVPTVAEVQQQIWSQQSLLSETETLRNLPVTGSFSHSS